MNSLNPPFPLSSNPPSVQRPSAGTLPPSHTYAFGGSGSTPLNGQTFYQSHVSSNFDYFSPGFSYSSLCSSVDWIDATFPVTDLSLISDIQEKLAEIFGGEIAPRGFGQSPFFVALPGGIGRGQRYNYACKSAPSRHSARHLTRPSRDRRKCNVLMQPLRVWLSTTHADSVFFAQKSVF